MTGSTAYVILFLGTLLEAAVIFCALKRKLFRRYFFLNLYMLLCVVASLGRYHILKTEGQNSLTYRYFYFYSDALLTIVLFFVVASLYTYVLEELRVERYVRISAVVLLAGTAWFSYSVIMESSHRIFTHFAFELSQNLYFVGLVLTYALWATILKMRESRSLLVQLVLSLGVYFSAAAACFALSNLKPQLYASSAVVIAPIMGCLLPLSWAYAFWRVPEEARLAPARLAAVPR
jgi:hypothetical protein